MIVQGADCGAVLVDRHPLWLDAVEAVITRLGIRVVGKATSDAEAIELLAAQTCELLILDLAAVETGTDPIGFLRDLSERFQGLKTVVLSDDDSQQIGRALSAGAVAYVVKTAHPDDLATAIRQVFGHSIYLRDSRTLAPAAETLTAVQTELTRREVEILRLVAEGHSNVELAKILWVTEQTVKFHLSNIYRKLGVANRTEAGRWAQVHDLLPKSPTQRPPAAPRERTPSEQGTRARRPRAAAQLSSLPQEDPPAARTA